HRCSERHRLPGRGRVRCCGQSGGGCRFDEELPRDREEVRLYDTHARSANIRSAEAEEIVLTAGDAVVDRRMADEPGRRRRRGVPPQKWPYIGLNKHEIEGTCGWGGAASPIIGEVDRPRRRGDKRRRAVRAGQGVGRAGNETGGGPQGEGREGDRRRHTCPRETRWSS